MDQIDQIRRLEADGHSRSAIAEKLGLSRPTVRKYADMDDFSVPGPPVPGVRSSVLDPFVEWIDEVLRADKGVRVKQRHTAQRLFDRLVTEQGFTGSYSIVQRYVKHWYEVDRLGEGAGGFNDLVWPAGTGQVDFGEADFDTEAGRVAKSFLVVSFPFSNRGLCQVFDGETAECVCQGLKDVFEAIVGVPPVLVFDNGAGVGRRVVDGVRETELFTRFRLHYGFDVRFCNPYAGHEKGNVENKVGFTRRNLFVPVVDLGGVRLEDYNRRLLADDADAHRVHYEKDVPVGELFAQDQRALAPLPARGFEVVRWASYRVDGYGKITVDGVHVYSVAPEAAKTRVWVGFRAHTVEVLTQDGVHLATHRRGYGKKRSEHIDHTAMISALVAKPGAWANSELRRDLGDRRARGFLDHLDEHMLAAYLRVIKTQARTHGLGQVLDGLDWLVANRREFSPADLGTVTARLDGFGLDRAPDPGPDLGAYDAAFGMGTTTGVDL